MRRSIMLGVVLAALSFAGCKKDKKADEGTASGSAMTGSAMAGSGSAMAGSGTMAGSGSAMAGSGTMAGSGSAAAGSGTMAGSGSAAAGSGSAAAASGDPGCTKYAERFAACEKLDPKVKDSMAKVFEGLKAAPTAKETCANAAKGWDSTLSKAGC